MARKKKHAEHVNHERWLVSYADFITLLFAFFVVMFAASNADQKKAGQVAKAVQGAFHDLAIFSPSGTAVPLFDGSSINSKGVIDNQAGAMSEAQIVGRSNPHSEGGEMGHAKAQLEQLLETELKEGKVRLTEDSRGLVVSLAEAGFFDPGSAIMQPKALPTIDHIAAIVKDLSYNVRVEGHTDDRPIRTMQFPSNWELSTTRATQVLRYLIAISGIPPERLSAMGYGEYRPVAPNETAEGRAANRRVDLVILGAAALKLEPK